MSQQKGKTGWEILKAKFGKSKPLELQYHNPLGVRVGSTISFDHEPDIAGINFVVEKIGVYETVLQDKSFFHTDYYLRGVTLEMEKPLRFRLRLLPDQDESNELRCKLQLLYLYKEREWSDGLYTAVNDPSGELHENQDDEGNDLDEPRIYWRIEDVLDPYHSKVTLLADKDGDGTIEDSELERYNVTYFDYSRLTPNKDGQEVLEFLTVEMNDKTRWFEFLRGNELQAFQLTVI